MDYLNIEEIIKQIDDPNQEICYSFLNENIALLKKSKGSLIKHQSWEGGYLDHIADIMNICIVLYNQYNSLRNLPFTLSDALLLLFLHDIEKPWKYLGDSYSDKLKNKKDQKEFRKNLIFEYGFTLSEYQWDALRYIEGENDDYSHDKRLMNELSAFCHICDVTSARIWYDFPKGNKW